MAHRILDSIESPDNLKLLTNEELSILAHEILMTSFCSMLVISPMLTCL